MITIKKVEEKNVENPNMLARNNIDFLFFYTHDGVDGRDQYKTQIYNDPLEHVG
jgi:hypothetical protein